MRKIGKTKNRNKFLVLFMICVLLMGSIYIPVNATDSISGNNLNEEIELTADGEEGEGTGDGGGTNTNPVTVTVDFGEGSWTIGNVTVTSDKKNKQELLTSDIITLTNFNADTMVVKVEGSDNFNVTLSVSEGKTSLSARTTEGGYPDGELTFSVVQIEDSNQGGGDNPNGGDGNQGPTITNPVSIKVNVTDNSNYLDKEGNYIQVDGINVTNNSTVTVEQKAQHTISLLPMYGMEITGITINGNDVSNSGTTLEGWVSYTVDEVESYDIQITDAKRTIYTVVWFYDEATVEDAKVLNGTVMITDAVMPGEESGSGFVGENHHGSEGGHYSIKPGSEVTVKITPDYGYQFVKSAINGVEVTAGSEVSQFTFTMPEANLHLSALFTKTEDTINITSSDNSITGGSIANGAKVVGSGNLKLDIKELEDGEKTAAENAMGSLKGSDDIKLCLDMNLSQVVNKGTLEDVWETTLTDLDGELSVTLNLDASLNDGSGTYYVIREHGDSYKKIPAAYDASSGSITFETDKFSTYAIVLGKALNATNSQTNDCSAELSETDTDLYNKVLDDNDKTAYENGTDVKVYLKTKDITSSVSDGDKSLAEANKGNAVIGTYLDIDLLKKVGNNDEQNVTSTNGAITITLTVPSELINSNPAVTRTYKMIRVHDGSADVIDCNFTNGKISFETDKFSTYALAYINQANNSGNGGNTGDNYSGGSYDSGSSGTVNATNASDTSAANASDSTRVKDAVPKTGDDSQMTFWFAIMMISGISTIALAKRKYTLKKEK